jgi:hypothetical protein
MAVTLSCASGEQPVGLPLDTYQPPRGDGVVGPCSDCNDSNPCTQDLCLAAGGCSYPPQVGQTCDDGDGCTSDDQCDATGACKGKDATDWIYRFKHHGKNSYYYSRSKTGPPKGYGFEKKLFRILKTSTPNSKPLYRLFSAKQDEFMLSLKDNEAAACCGYVNNGIVGHFYPKEQPKAVKLHRLKSKEGTALRHLSSLDASEGLAQGYTYEGSPGYVCN